MAIILFYTILVITVIRVIKIIQLVGRRWYPRGGVAQCTLARHTSQPVDRCRERERVRVCVCV